MISWKYQKNLTTVSETVLQRNRTSKTYIERDKRRLSILGIGLHDCGGWDIPWSALCKLENQANQRCHSVWVWRPENKCRCQGAEDGCPSSSKESVLCSASLSYSGPQQIRWGPPALMILFAQSTVSNVDLFQNHPHRHTQK